MDTKGGFYISQIKQRQDRIFQKLVQRYGLDINGAQGRILFVLWHENHLTMTNIGLRTSLANTTLTSMIDRMVEKGILQRSVNENNRRQIIVSLTPFAIAMQSQYEEISRQMNSLFYEGFSPEEISVFENALKRVLRNLAKHGES